MRPSKIKNLRNAAPKIPASGRAPRFIETAMAAASLAPMAATSAARAAAKLGTALARTDVLRGGAGAASAWSEQTNGKNKIRRILKVEFS